MRIRVWIFLLKEGYMAEYGEKDTFYSPFCGSVLVKAEEENDQWIVYLEASNEGIDQDAEIIMAKALREARDYYLKHGVLSWDHKHKILHDPGFIVGEPLDVAIDNNNKTLVKGWLYKKNPIAQRLWNNIQSGAQKLGASIGGGIIQKSKGKEGSGVSNVIERVIWDETAITHKPVNDDTLGHVQLIPFEAFAKALMAGAGVDASSYSGGRALTGENLDRTLIDETFGQIDTIQNLSYEESRRFFDQLWVQINQGKITSMNDVISYTLDQGYDTSVAGALIQFIAKKLPQLR